jgi:hypothetical protein
MVGEKGEGAKVSGLQVGGLQIAPMNLIATKLYFKIYERKNPPLSFFGSIFSLILLF